tara:strand:- start:431 stop:643 length:213 start_codon:yes stop_codon:yes gene_type:complete
VRDVTLRFNLKIVTADENHILDSDVAFYPLVFQIKNMDVKELRGELYVGWEYILLKDDLRKHVQKNREKF